MSCYGLLLAEAAHCQPLHHTRTGDLRGPLQLIQHTTAVTASPEHIRTQLKRLVGPSWQTPKLASHLLGCRIDYRLGVSSKLYFVLEHPGVGCRRRDGLLMLPESHLHPAHNDTAGLQLEFGQLQRP
jgi:hypothetical protein